MQFTADITHSKSTTRKSYSLSLQDDFYPVFFGQYVYAFHFDPLENIWRGHGAFKTVLALPRVRLARSLLWSETSVAVSRVSSFICIDAPEIEF